MLTFQLLWNWLCTEDFSDKADAQINGTGPFFEGRDKIRLARSSQIGEYFKTLLYPKPVDNGWASSSVICQRLLLGGKYRIAEDEFQSLSSKADRLLEMTCWTIIFAYLINLNYIQWCFQFFLILVIEKIKFNYLVKEIMLR